jgi:prophage regulatory protein
MHTHDISEKRARLVPRQDVLERVPFSDTTLWRMERRGEFPRCVRISPGRVGYLESEVEAWIAKRAEDAR